MMHSAVNGLLFLSTLWLSVSSTGVQERPVKQWLILPEEAEQLRLSD